MASKRVLIVDDSRSARHVLKRQLKQHGLVVDEVESAEDALQYLLYNKPHAIFMDHMMPGMDGLQAVRVIKGNPATGLIPIIMFTSKEGGQVYLNQARALGAAGVLPKQIDSKDLEALLDSLHLLDAQEEVAPPVLADAAEQEGAEPMGEMPAADMPPPVSPDPHVHALQREAADDELLRLLRPHLDAQARRLQSSLRQEIRALAEKLQPERRPLSRRRLSAAAAGLLLGVFLTSSFYNLVSLRSQAGPAPAAAGIALTADQCPMPESKP